VAATTKRIADDGPVRRPTARSFAHWENVGLQSALDVDKNLTLGVLMPSMRGPNWIIKKLPITKVLVSLNIERTMDGASTVTLVIRDPEQTFFAIPRAWRSKINPQQAKIKQAWKKEPAAIDDAREPLLEPKLAARAVELVLDGVTFRLVKARYVYSSGELELTFEDRLVYWLKRKKSKRAKRASRAKVTRAEFILSLLRELPVGEWAFFCPALHDKQAIGRADDPKDKTKRSSNTSSGSSISDNSSLRVGGHAISVTQRQEIETAMAVASREGASERPTLAMLCAGIGESGFRAIPNSAGSGYAGVFQADPKNIPMKDTETQAYHFLRGGKGFQAGGAIALAKKDKSLTPGTIATKVEASGQPGSFYDKYRSEADAILQNWGGVEGSDATRTIVQPFQFARNEDEDSWACIQRLAEEVGWRFFVSGKTFYFMSESDLFAQRVRYEVKPGDTGLVDLNYDVDWGKPVSECELTINLGTSATGADRWAAPPGVPVLLNGFDVADGRWLIKSASRDWFSPTLTVSLAQPATPKQEPAATTQQRSVNVGDADMNTKGGARGLVENAVKIAKDAGGANVYVASDSRPGSVTTSGSVSDHSQNNASRAARDIAVRGIDAIVGPPSPKLDDAVVAVGKAFGRDYGNGKRVIDADTFEFRGYRVQIIWRTPKYGGHMGHIHVGARKS